MSRFCIKYIILKLYLSQRHKSSQGPRLSSCDGFHWHNSQWPSFISLSSSSLRRWLHSQGKFVSCSPQDLQLENPPFCKWISQPDPDEISPRGCQLSNGRFQPEEEFIFYEVLHVLCFDLSEGSQILRLDRLLWGIRYLETGQAFVGNTVSTSTK